MNQVERLYKIEQLLGEAHTVPIAAMLERLEISRATFKRDLAYLRDRLNAPIVWDRFGGGYRFEPQRRTGARHAGHAGPKHAGPKHELPGLWFNSSEAYALLAMQQLLKEIDPGILAGQIEPLAVRLRALLGSSGDDIAEVEKRIKLLQVGARRANPQHFSHIARAVLTRRPNHKSADPLHLTRQRRSHRPPGLAAASGEHGAGVGAYRVGR